MKVSSLKPHHLTKWANKDEWNSMSRNDAIKTVPKFTIHDSGGHKAQMQKNLNNEVIDWLFSQRGTAYLISSLQN